MDAPAYLTSLGLEVQPPISMSIGRLALVGEFRLNGRRGVVVRPKRGGVSDRYLALLAADGVDYVVIDGTVPLPIYGRGRETGELEPLRALPVSSPSRFPSHDVLTIVCDLVQRVCRGSLDALSLGSKLLAEKIVEEKSLPEIFEPAIASSRHGAALQRLADRGFILPSGHGEDALATAIGLLSGYALTPTSVADVAALLDALACLADAKPRGLPAAATFAFSGRWCVGGRTLVVAEQLGAHLLPLHTAEAGYAVLPIPGVQDNPLLSRLFPTTSFIDTAFLAWQPKALLNRVIIVPPLGRSIGSPDLPQPLTLDSRIAGKFPAPVPAEVLYIEHALRLAEENALVVAVLPDTLLSSAGHAGFRDWLLERVELLAVLSLPSRACFTGSSIRCSVLYLKKSVPPPSDYPIAMIEAEETDVLEPQALSGLQIAIDNALLGKAST